jgi:hypothetical protein
LARRLGHTAGTTAANDKAYNQLHHRSIFISLLMDKLDTSRSEIAIEMHGS